jgi:hypothetical protein
MARLKKPLPQKELQRKIYLNTMRKVYPNSLQIHYIYSSSDESFIIQPLSVQPLCKEIPDKLWAELTDRLNTLFIQHVRQRRRIMLTLWSVFFAILLLYILVGWRLQLGDRNWFLITGPIVFPLLALIVPNITYSLLIVRPFLHRLEEWQHHLVIQLGKCGLEIVKVTTGDIVSDRAPWHLFWMFYYGSSVWFRFEDSKVEVFWRSVKSGQRVRRYSLMISSSNNNSSNDNYEASDAIDEADETADSSSTLQEVKIVD